MDKTIGEINELSTKALINAREKIEQALEENFFDSSFSEDDKIRYVNFAQTIAQISVITTTNILLEHFKEKE